MTDILPFRATETTLDNGLCVIVVPTGFPNLVSLQIPVQAGSRNEVESGKSGFAHFFEHMMFRGTERFPAHAYQEVMTRTGARQNAYTTDDYTNYHVTFAAEDLETVLDLEADRFMNLAYSEPDFRTEARAVLGEYNKSSSEPLNKLIEVQRDHAFNVHTYKHTTMGFLADIEEMPNQFGYAQQFFERWYRPEYSTVLLAGDLDPAATLTLVERYWSGWTRGSFSVAVPQEDSFKGPVRAHVPWATPTLPWVTVAFHGPAFSDSDPAYSAFDTLLDLWFGETSDLYQRLVRDEQKVDQLFPHLPSTVDPQLGSVFARLQDGADAVYVRDAILETFARARSEAVSDRRLEEAKSHSRYAFARTLDNSESIAATLARFVRFDRSYDTLNRLFETLGTLTPDHLLEAGQRYITEERLVLTTLAHGELADAPLPSLAAPVTEATLGSPQNWVVLDTPSPLITLKLQFQAGSAHDPVGKQGLAYLAGQMVSEAGSEELKIDEITKALFPIAGSFGSRVDREVTTFTGVIHRDNLDRFADLVLPQLLRPGFRTEDFSRLKEQQKNALLQDLRSNNDEELGKECLQAAVFAGTPYEHPPLGTEAGIASLTLEDVRGFMSRHFTRENLVVGLAGDVPSEFKGRLVQALAGLPAGTTTPRVRVTGRQTSGLEVEIVQKETRAVAISLGHAIEPTRAHPDFPALWLARSWLGEHRASQGRLFQRLREVRGLNYGDYAYVEAFPGGMYGFFPPPNTPRQAQLFEIWIRPVIPAHAVFALKLALFELRGLLARGLSLEEFDATRNYLMKNVFLMTKTQSDQLGYALDSRWHGLPEFTAWMREQLAALTVEQLNGAMRRHWSGENLQVIMVAKDAEGLRRELLSDEPTSIEYDSPKPPDIVAEDRIVGAMRLGLTEDRVRITTLVEQMPAPPEGQ
jgi:zinc protease